MTNFIFRSAQENVSRRFVQQMLTKMCPNTGSFNRSPAALKCKCRLLQSTGAELRGARCKQSKFRRESRAHDSDLSGPRTGIPFKLIERQGTHEISLAELQEWRSWARKLARWHVKNFDSLDGSPNIFNLYREIDWLIEDNVDAVRYIDSAFFDSRLSETVLNEVKLLRSRLEQLSIRLALSEMKTLWETRLINRVPLQYLTNTAHWRDLELTVTRAVLIPRPETEMLIDFAIEALRELNQSPKHANSFLPEGPWLDLGTGSGALAISLAKELISVVSQPRVYAVDVSLEAAEIARHNVAQHGLTNVVTVTTGSWFESFDETLLFSGILSNPPYIPTSVLSTLQPEVFLHEPIIALDGGANRGEAILISICKDSIGRLLPGGLLALETHDLEQATLIAEYLTASKCFQDTRLRKDLSGIYRFVTARKQL